MGRIVGIDLGTTNSVVAVIEGSEPVVIPIAEGGHLCPSVIGFTRLGERLVGSLAKRQAITNSDRTFASIKRRMGTAEPFLVDSKNYTAPELSAMVLRKLKADAEAFLGEPVEQAVITVPAYFNDAQRQATRDAGLIAGLEVVRILNEPTAAALAYGLDQKSNLKTVLVWDLGGGTFDVSILELGEGVFEVKATSGDTQLGGDDWDTAIIQQVRAAFEQQHGVSLEGDLMALQRLKEAAERAKMELSHALTTTIHLPFLCQKNETPLHLEVTLNRAQLEELTRGLLDRMREPTYRALNDAQLAPRQIDRVILVGGATRMPAVRALAREIFGQEPSVDADPDELVARGAAIQAGVLVGQLANVVLLDVTPLSLGIETIGGLMTRLIPRNTAIPTSRSEVFTTAADGQTAVEVHVVQGEREMASDNVSLGKFQLCGIPPAPRGVPKIEILFDIDANGIVQVKARDQKTGLAQQIQVIASSGMSRQEVGRMIEEAASQAEADRLRREHQELLNQVDSALYQAGKTFQLAEGKVEVGLLQRARAASDSLQLALVQTDMVALEQRLNELTKHIYAVTTALHQESPAVSELPALGAVE